MIRRLDLTSDSRLHEREWPDADTEGSHLFAARKPYRKITVMIDAELMLWPNHLRR